MARYENHLGEAIETHGSVYIFYGIEGSHETNVGKWCESAEEWIDRDIESGRRTGFRKVGE